jgi:hypothetical protein
MNDRTDDREEQYGMTEEQRVAGTAALAEAAARDEQNGRNAEQNGRDAEQQREAETPGANAPRSTADEQSSAPLFADDASDDYRSRWSDVQSRFVDDPREAVKEADGLVADLMKDLARSFADERSQLEGQWSRGDDVSTEDLRVALQRYRSFFSRLLSI